MPLITYLTTIQFDFGAVKLLGQEVAAVGIERPLVVTDKGLVQLGLAQRVLENLPKDMPVTMFDGTPENPTEEAILQATALYREAGCDGLIAIGGGSSMDLAKGVAIMATHEPPLAQYAAIEGGVAKITARVAPTVAVPTTAGTGSEVGRGAVLSLSDGRKLGFVSPHNIPRRVICDPELTLGLPARLTAATGMDAVAHCIETFLAPAKNPPAEAIALDGLRRAAKNLERAVANGGDREARWEMMMAALEGGMTFQKGLGAVHAMSHPLGAIRKPVLHHGTLNAVVLPAVLRFNAGHVGDKYDALRQAMGVAAGTPMDEALADLNARIGMPAGLGAMGVDPAIIPQVSAAAEKDHCTATNPRPATRADYEKLFAEAM
ncbi:MAG: iron-containing alcohol dehydrogenase [Alphaproteobacteria bacterium]